MRGLGGLSPMGEHSGTYLHLNRGKRNVCLDLKKVGARSVITRLVAAVAVIVSDMRPKALERPREFDGGRQWFTSLGHRKDDYAQPAFRRHLLGGIESVVRDAPRDYTRAYAVTPADEPRRR